MKIGYARVSTTGQNLDMQIEALNNVGCEKIYTEKESGVKERPVLQELLSFIRQGDTLVVYKLDRLGRSMKDLLGIIEQLQNKKVNLVSLKDNIDTSSTAGKLVFHIFASLAEFERNLIKDRTSEGRAAAKKKGVKFGRPKNATNDKAKACAKLYKSEMTVLQIQEQLNIKSKSTVYRFLRMEGIEPSRNK